MAGQTTVQQWTDEYNRLDQNLKSINQTIDVYLKNGGGDSPALYEAQRQQLRLEYQINQQIDSAYTPTLIDTYLAYQGEKIGVKTNISIDGILYNNIGQPLTWNPDATWGLFNQFKEARNYVRTLADYHLAGWMQDKRADIVALFSGLANEALDPSDKVFGSVLVNSNPYLQKMAEMVLGQALGKAMPDNKAIVKVSYDNVYEYFFGDYDPALEGLVLDPWLLKDSSQAFFQSVEGSQIQSAIEHLTAPNTGPSSLLGLLKQKLTDLNIGSGAVTGPAQNPNTIFDLSVDPSGLKPTNPDSLGSSTHGWGLLAGGAGYTAAASSTYVNSDGLVNTALSNIVADGIRPGNHSLNKTTDLANALRATNFGSALSQGTGQMVLTNLPAGSVTSLPNQLISNQHDGQTTTFTGTLHFDDQGRTIAITPNAGSVAYVNGQQVVFDGRADVILSPNQNHLTNGGLAAGWFVQSHDAEGRQLQLTYDGKSLIYTDPLSLDAGNDGIRMSATPVNFDLNADGSPEAVRWTAPTDPLLVLDVNGDGRINHGSELVDLTNSDVPLNLFSLDSLNKGGNGDQILNANDSAFAQLQLWTDRNQDGYASAEERQSLTDLGIVSIDLNPTHLQTSTVANPIAGQTGIKGVVATYADGSHKTLWDVPLQTGNSTAHITSSAYGTSGAIDKITGSGQTALVAKSAFGVTVDLNNSGATQAIGSFGNDTLIGTNGDDWLTGGAGADNFNAGAGADLLIIDADDQPANIDAGAGIDTLLVADDRGVFLNLAKTHSEVVYGGFGDDVFVGGGADNVFIDGAAGDDLIIGGSVDDVLSGGDGADVLEGLAGDDLIRGHRGQDQLLGGDGNDVLDGGLDNDTLQGGNGNDVILASGGTDTVDGGSGIDMIELKGNLEDYSFVHNDNVANGSWTITDHKNNNGKLVPAGQVSDRNGVQQINNVERFSYMTGNRAAVMDFALWNPLPVNDRIENVCRLRSNLGNSLNVYSNAA